MTHLKFYVEAIKLLVLSLFLVLILGVYSFRQDTFLPVTEDLGFCAVLDDSNETVQAGKILFKSNCATCHNKNMKDDMTGPALAGTLDKWSAYPKEDLYAWIQNSQELIAADHPLAKAVWKDWKPIIMPAFPKLEASEIDAIMEYVEDNR